MSLSQTGTISSVVYSICSCVSKGPIKQKKSSGFTASRTSLSNSTSLCCRCFVTFMNFLGQLRLCQLLCPTKAERTTKGTKADHKRHKNISFLCFLCPCFVPFVYLPPI